MKLKQHPAVTECRSAGFPVCGFSGLSSPVPLEATGKSPRPADRNSDGSRAGVRATSAFTLVEVAIALAVIGFALVAIIGILPAGLNVQKENREETIINQEVSIWMDAIRSGAQGLDYLTNYVDGIEIVSTELDADGVPITSTEARNSFTRFGSSLGPDYALVSGFRIIGLLSWPAYEEVPNNTGVVYSNRVVAYVRAISGSAAEKAPQDNETVRDSAFSYQLTSEVVPFIGITGPWTNHSHFFLQSSGTNGVLARTLSENASDVRLQFRWPVRPPYDFQAAPPQFPSKIGNARQSFRALVGGRIEYGTDPLTGVSNFSFIHPGVFAKAADQP